MELDDTAKQIVEDLGAAINRAVERSNDVAETIERLREAGYEMELTLRLDIGLRQRVDEEDADETVTDTPEFELTDEDRRTLRGMRIKIDDNE